MSLSAYSIRILSLSSIIVLFIGIEISAQVNQQCTTDGSQSLRGECRNVKNCKAVISNLRAGINPTLCSNPTGGQPLVCCPERGRISAKKCDQFQQIRNRMVRPLPLLPQEFYNSTQQRLNNHEEVKCVVNPTPFIHGGRDAKLHEFPYMVALGYGELKEKKWFCGGSLISEDFVVTAAHCIDTAYGRPRRVLVGQLYLKNPSNESRRSLVAVSETIVHPNFKKPLKYDDIALLKLNKKVRLTKAVLPICLPQPEERLELVDKNLTIAGWGTVGAFGDQSNILQAATLNRYAQKDCNTLFISKTEKNLYYPQGIIRSQLCAVDKKHDTCRGDSGGPLTATKIVNGKCTDFLVGLTSFGSQYCGFSEPGVYTNIQSYLDFIEQHVWPGQV